MFLATRGRRKDKGMTAHCMTTLIRTFHRLLIIGFIIEDSHSNIQHHHNQNTYGSAIHWSIFVVDGWYTLINYPNLWQLHWSVRPSLWLSCHIVIRPRRHPNYWFWNRFMYRWNWTWFLVSVMASQIQRNWATQPLTWKPNVFNIYWSIIYS